MWNNRKSFLLFLWGCHFIYRPEEPLCHEQQSTGSGTTTAAGTAGNPNNIVHETFYIHDIRYTIMGYL